MGLIATWLGKAMCWLNNFSLTPFCFARTHTHTHITEKNMQMLRWLNKHTSHKQTAAKLSNTTVLQTHLNTNICTPRSKRRLWHFQTASLLQQNNLLFFFFLALTSSREAGSRWLAVIHFTVGQGGNMKSGQCIMAAEVWNTTHSLQSHLVIEPLSHTVRRHSGSGFLYYTLR